jgi:mRNA interferase RelE/StbE
MSFKLLIHPKALKKLNSLQPDIKKLIKNKLLEFVKDPFAFDIKKIVDAGKYPKYRLRVGDYRLIFTIDYDSNTIYVLRFFHRKEGYDKFL